MNKKKILIIAVIVLTISVLVVCGLFFIKVANLNTLTCSSSHTSNGIKIEQKYIISYKKDKIEKVAITKSFGFSDQKRFNNFNSVVVPNTDSKMSKMENSDLKFTSNVSGMTYTTKTEANPQNLKDSEIKDLGINKSLKSLETNLQSQGLICK